MTIVLRVVVGETTSLALASPLPFRAGLDEPGVHAIGTRGPAWTFAVALTTAELMMFCDRDSEECGTQRG
jgi:hypothetical protein